MPASMASTMPCSHRTFEPLFGAPGTPDAKLSVTLHSSGPVSVINSQRSSLYGLGVFKTHMEGARIDHGEGRSFCHVCSRRERERDAHTHTHRQTNVQTQKNTCTGHDLHRTCVEMNVPTNAIQQLTSIACCSNLSSHSILTTVHVHVSPPSLKHLISSN